MLHIGICDDDIHMLHYLTQLCALNPSRFRNPYIY